MRIQSKYLDEKLTAADPTSKWISDFVHSDNPKFAGKSKKERIKMALGASYAAKGQSKNEETYKDTGWKSPERNPGAKTKNVSGRLARQGMKQAEKETKKVKEEVEDLAELSKETLTKYATRTRFSSDPKHREGSMKAMEKVKKKEEKVEEDNKAYRAQDTESKRTTGMSLQQRSKMYDDIQKKLKDQEEEYRKQGILPPKNEAVSQDKKDELRSELGHEDHLPHTVHINGKPWKKFEGYNAGPRAKKATDTLNAKGKKATYGISEEVDESIGSAIGGAIGQYTGSKIGMDGPGRAHGELAGRAIEYHVRKFAKKIKDKFTKKANEEYALEESHFEIGQKVKCIKSGMTGKVIKTDKPETGKYYTVKQDSGKVMKYAPDELKALNEEERDPNYEKVDMAKTQAHFIKYAAEEILEYLDMGGEIEEWYQNKLSKVHSDVEGLHSWMEGNKRKEGMVEEVEQIDELSKGTLADYAKKATHDARIKHGIGKDFERISKSSRKPEYKQSAKEWEDKYKSDARRREAGVGKAIDRLAKEEVEQVDEVLDSAGKLAGYLGKATLSGLRSAATGTGKFRKRQAGIQRAVDKTKEKINNEEVEQVDEISQNVALNAYAKRAARADKTGDKREHEKADKMISRIGKKWDADAQRRAWNRADKLRNEETEELEEDGKLKGGAKDPCWKGYQMVGTKKKGGREVPNCVPREETELKSFKALREKVNGYQ